MRCDCAFNSGFQIAASKIIKLLELMTKEALENKKKYLSYQTEYWIEKGKHEVLLGLTETLNDLEF